MPFIAPCKKLIKRCIDKSAAPISVILAAIISNPRCSNALKNILIHAFKQYAFKQSGMDCDPVTLLKRDAALESANFIKDHLNEAILFKIKSLKSFWDFALAKASSEGLFCEFGVFRGSSINYFAEKRPNVTWHGFDSFEGLPEDWKGHFLPKGTFDRSKDGLPVVRENVQLHQGWFELTLPKFAEGRPGQMSFMHIDCDLYSSTKTVFDVLGERIQAGTVIVFDDYLNFPAWQEHGHKAFMEFCAYRRVKYNFIAFHDRQAAVLIMDLG